MLSVHYCTIFVFLLLFIEMRKSSGESNALKPRVSSPVCKSMSLDRNSIHKSECSRVEVDGSAGEASYTGLRRRMSEPHEFVGTPSTDLTNSEDKVNCYHNLWCCKEPSDEATVANKPTSCEDFVGQCFDGVSGLLTDRANHSSRLSGSLSKICCLPTEHELKAGKNDRRGHYVNVGREETGAKENMLSRDKRPNSVRNTKRCSYDDISRCREGEQEAELLLADNPSSDYINESTYSVPTPIAPRQGRSLLQRRACDDPPSARDPLKPLPYVDLRRFDGDVDEGYLYWMKGPRPDRRKMSSAGSRSRETAKEGVSYPSVRLSTYTNMQTPSSGERHVPCDSSMVAVDSQWKLANGGRSSYHASLKRPGKMSILSSMPPAPSSGSYAELRLDPTSSQSMLRSSSYYNVRLNTVIPLPPRKPENKDKPSVVRRTLPPTPSAPAFVARKGSMSEAVFASPSCRRSSSLKTENIVAPHVDYIPMCGQLQGDDNAIFFAVNIPPKRDDLRPIDQPSISTESNSTEACPARSFNALPPAAVSGDDSVGYIDMSGAATVAAGVHLSDGSTESTMWRPRLRQSRSLENELDSSPEAEDMRYLVNRRTSHGAIVTGKKWAQTYETVARPAADDYVPMEGLLGERPAHELAQSQVFAKPFDNLISHERFKLPASSAEVQNLTHGKRDTEAFASDSAINFLSYRSNSVKSSKASGLFSRFIRRHSSAKEKLRPATDPKTPSLNDAEPNVSTELAYVKPVSVSNSSSSSSLDRLGPPPPVPVAPQHSAAAERNQLSEHYINLASVSSGLPVSLPLSTSDCSSSDYLSLAPPPPLPPKALVLSKSHEPDCGFRNCVVPPAVVSEKARGVEKQQLRSITEDEQEVPPLPEKIRNRSACQSKLLAPDSPTVIVTSGLDASPKPPVPPRSVTSNVISSGAGVVITQRSPRLPVSPADRESQLVKPDALKSRKPNLTVDIVPTAERRGSRDDAGIPVIL